VTVGHIAGGEAGYRGHAIKGIGQHLALRAHRWQCVEPWNAEMGDALRPNSICELERFHVMKRYTYARMVALNVGRQSGVSLAQSGRLVPALIGVPVTILIPCRHVQLHISVQINDESELRNYIRRVCCAVRSKGIT
jgi:hypothetical protein